jgi:spermidine synthase
MPPLYALPFLSGLAGLGYEVLWTRMLSLGVGHEMPAVLAVVAAFFFGMAAGSWALDGVIGRSATPGRWYAVLEGIVGFWALMLLALWMAVETCAYLANSDFGDCNFPALC